MLPELRHLRYLRAVADHGNFTRAAQDLHVSQPTLSQQIQQLERGVGAQLLDRSGRSVRLTDAGDAYLAHARRALRELATGERAVNDVNDLSRGELRLAVTQGTPGTGGAAGTLGGTSNGLGVGAGGTGGAGLGGGNAGTDGSDGNPGTNGNDGTPGQPG